MKNKIPVGILLTFVVLLCTVKASIFTWTPRYTAQAEFTVDWNQIALNHALGDDKDFNIQKARAEYDNTLAGFKASDQFVSLLCKKCNLPDTKSDSIADDLCRNLSIVRVGKTGDDDLYQVQFADDNRQIALKAVNLLSRRLVIKINVEAKIQNAKQAFDSYKDNTDANGNEERLNGELASLGQQQNQEYSMGRQEQIQEINGEVNQTDLTKMETGFKTIFNVGSIFVNPAAIQGHGVIEAN